MIKWYCETWWAVMVRPIWFYTFIPEGEWHEKALTFASATSWIISFALTSVIFIIQYIPIGLYLVEGLDSWKLLLVSPVILAISAAFFLMTLLIVGGLILAAILGFQCAFGVILHYALKLLGGKGTLQNVIKSTFYSSATFVFLLIPFLFMVTTKYKLTEVWQLSAIENIMYYTACLYIYGLWSIAMRKAHNVPRWTALLASILPLAILVFVGVVFHSKVFPKIGGFLN